MKRVYKESLSFVALVLIPLFVISCSSSKYSAVNFKTGNYGFSMSDSTANTLIEGTMKLDTNAGGKIYGSYSITKKYVNDFPGLSTMTGSCEGTYVKSEGMIHLNMNPKLADANVFISAKIYRNSLAGDWAFSTFRNAISNKGKFIATYTN
jgi:hypothetical protein